MIVIASPQCAVLSPLFFLLSAFFPYAGFLVYIAGVILGDRLFSHIHLSVMGKPLYLAEAVLAGLILNLAWKAWRTKSFQWPSIKNHWAWILLYVIALQSFLRGFRSEGLAPALRDSALIYYSVLFFITMSVVSTPKKLKRLGIVTFFCAAIKIGLFYNQLDYAAWWVSQPAAASMYLSLFLIFGWILFPTQGRLIQFLTLPLMGYAMMLLLLYQVRTAWIGVAGALFVGAVFLLSSGKWKWAHSMHLALSVLLFVGLVKVEGKARREKFDDAFAEVKSLDKLTKYGDYLLSQYFRRSGQDSSLIDEEKVKYESHKETVAPIPGDLYLSQHPKLAAEIKAKEAKAAVPVKVAEKPKAEPVKTSEPVKIVETPKVEPVKVVQAPPVVQVAKPIEPPKEQIVKPVEAPKVEPVKAPEPVKVVQAPPAVQVAKPIEPPKEQIVKPVEALKVEPVKAPEPVKVVQAPPVEQVTKPVEAAKVKPVVIKETPKSETKAEVVSAPVAKPVEAPKPVKPVNAAKAKAPSPVVPPAVPAPETANKRLIDDPAFGTVRTRLWMWTDMVAELKQDHSWIWGVAMGKPWFPPSIITWWREPRIDPHNSFMAVLYRTGVLGLTAFLLVLGMEFWFLAVSFFRKNLTDSAKYLVVACLGGALYCALHAMTDVTFENPFKGIPIWVILGLGRTIVKFGQKKEPVPEIQTAPVIKEEPVAVAGR